MAQQINVKDPAMARQWLANVNRIIQAFNQAMSAAGNELTSLSECMEGTLVDNYVELGNKLLVAAKNTFDAVNKIADTVNNILSVIKNFSENIDGGIASDASKLFG